MRSAADVKLYLHQLELTSEEPRENTWVVHNLDGLDNLVITLAEPVVVFRVKLMDLPGHHREELYRTLLELNASELYNLSF